VADAAVVAAVDERRAVAREGEPAGLCFLVLFRQVKLYRDNSVRSSAHKEENICSPIQLTDWLLVEVVLLLIGLTKSLLENPVLTTRL
jgi:hypothetical protein